MEMTIQAMRLPDGVALRESQPGDMGWVVQKHGEIYAREYGWNAEFETMVAGIVAGKVARQDPEWERGWVAERDGQRLGCVFVMRKNATEAQLRLLILVPEARGLGLGGLLTDTCVAFARDRGYATMTLSTYRCLEAARANYARRGFTLADCKALHRFGQDVHEEQWRLIL